MECRPAIAVCLFVAAFLLGATGLTVDGANNGTVLCGSLLSRTTSLGLRTGLPATEPSERHATGYTAQPESRVLVGAWVVAGSARRRTS
jgi:hypothetical protein